MRAFVSSTLRELAPERAAVRAAIERLHLVPVMFELGARPHPPRDLYRAYLDQSDVFIGIYGESYGWIAPGERWSGLEDEYRLAGDRPRLLYLKEPAPEREPRLATLIERFAADDRASYKPFSTPDELGELVANDLALLLSERFGAEERDGGSTAPVPAAPNTIVGRARELAQVLELLEGGARLVTLTGTGGIGKTRLAIAIADALDAGVDRAFVPLSAVGDADRAIRTVADSLRAHADGSRAPLDALADHLRDHPVVLVLDNLEQIDDIGPPIARLLELAPDLQILATSRRALRLRAEREVAVPPLALPDEVEGTDETDVDHGAAVELFVDRAQAVGVAIDLDGPEGATVVEICRRLEGLPLAIELAAARSRLLPPAALLDRLADRLDFLVADAPDVPERQRTLRSTIDWSHQLLDDDQRALLARLSVFVDGWTLDAAEAVCGGDGVDVVDGLAALLDSSLITPRAGDGPPRFAMYESVRAFAAEQLDGRGERRRLEERHLAHVLQVGERAQPHLCGPGQREWVRQLGPERENLRAAVAVALDRRRYADVVELVWDVVVLYLVTDAGDVPSGWITAVAEAAPQLDPVTEAKLRSMHALMRIHRGTYEDVLADLEEPLAVFGEHGMVFESAVALHQLGFVRYRLLGDTTSAVEALRESSTRFAALGHQWGVALVEAMLASVLAAEGDLAGAEASAVRSLASAREIENQQQIVQALHQLAVVRLLAQRELDALEVLVEAASVLLRERLRTDATYCLDALAVIALAASQLATATRAAEAARAERARIGVAPWPSLEAAFGRVLGEVRADADEPAPAGTDATGAEVDVFEVLEATLAALDRAPAPRA